MSFRAALWSTPYGWVKPGLGYSPNSGPPVGGLALMSPQGFFGDPTNALLPATAQRAHGASAIRGGFANGNWFFGRKGKFGLSPDEKARIAKEYGKRTSSPPPSNDGLRARRRSLARRAALQQRLSRRRPSFGVSHYQIKRMNAKIGNKRRMEDAAAWNKAAPKAPPQSWLAAAKATSENMRKYVNSFGTHSDSLSGMARPYPPNMRTFPMLGAYPGEVGPGILPGGTAGNGAFVGPENPLMSYYFTYGRRRSARKGSRRSMRRR